MAAKTPQTTAPTAPLKKGRVARARSSPEVAQEDGAALGTDDTNDAPRRVTGVALINLIRKKLLDKGLSERHISDRMGITSIYWNSLTNGNRRISSLPKEKLQHLAEFLEVPLIQVYVLAEHFTSEDFVVYKDLPADLERMIDFMRSDPKWLALAPSKKEWDDMPSRTKVLVATLYEQISHKSFLKATKIEIPAD